MRPFKKCPKCRAEWLDRDTFLADPEVRLIGYQVSFGDLAAGHFQFNHERAGCGTTVCGPTRSTSASSSTRTTRPSGGQRSTS